MLKNTFCHIPNITSGDERNLWEDGLHSWEDYRENLNLHIRRYKHKYLAKYLELSNENILQANPHFFAKLLPSKEHWRLFPEFQSDIAYIDIETTGLSEYDHITTIALYDGKEIKTYVYGQNLNDFKRDIKKYKIVVTYNGKCFDVPFIRRQLRIEMDHVHLDLRYILSSQGYSGGLKKCERALGVSRNGLEEVDGYFAIVLWREYQKTGDKKVLDTLLAYNIEDVVNLEWLMIMAYNLKIKATPFKLDLFFELPAKPDIELKG